MKHKRKVSSSAAQPMAANDIHVALETNNDGLMKSLDICVPVCVYSYDRVKHKVTVLPLVKQAYFNGKWKFLTRQPFSVAVRSFQCGGFCMDYPLFVGDTGWVFSSDRDTFFLKDKDSPTHIVLGEDRDLGVVEQVLPQKPMQPKIHSLTDGFFIPDNWGKWEFQRFKDADDVELRDALYIGTSFFDEDEEEAPSDDSDDKSGNKKDESDDSDSDESDSDVDDGTYEGHPSGSIILSRNGSVHLLSSSKEKAKKRAHIKLHKDKVSLELTDGTTDGGKMWSKVKMAMSLDEGLSIDCKGDTYNNSLMLDENGLEIKHGKKGSKTESATFTMSSALDVNITTPGNVYLEGKDITTNCKKISVIGEDTTFTLKNVNGTTNTININASESMTFNAVGDVRFASANSITLGSAGSISIGSVGDKGIVSIRSMGANGKVTIECNGGEGELSLAAGASSIKMQNQKIEVITETISFTTNEGLANGHQFINGGNVIIS